MSKVSRYRRLYIISALTATSAAVLSFVYGGGRGEGLSQRIAVLSGRNVMASVSSDADLRPPTNVAELLDNLRIALLRDYPAQSDFYSNDVLYKIFGVHQLDVRRKSSIGRSVEIYSSDLPGLLATRSSASNSSSGMTEFQASYRTSIAGHVETGGGFLFHLKGPGFAEVVSLLGPDWTAETVGYDVHDGPAPATAPHGNDRVFYRLTSSTRKWKLSIGFDSNGCLSQINYLGELR